MHYKLWLAWICSLRAWRWLKRESKHVALYCILCNKLLCFDWYFILCIMLVSLYYYFTWNPKFRLGYLWKSGLNNNQKAISFTFKNITILPNSKEKLELWIFVNTFLPGTTVPYESKTNNCTLRNIIYLWSDVFRFSNNFQESKVK